MDQYGVSLKELYEQSSADEGTHGQTIDGAALFNYIDVEGR